MKRLVGNATTSLPGLLENNPRHVHVDDLLLRTPRGLQNSQNNLSLLV